jgi:uncharacterized repeat protein (TIGR03803 family)
VAGAALALAIMIVPAVVATRSAQAETYTESVLYSFTGVDGSTPGASLILTNSNLYGTTNFGGDYGAGTVFKLTRAYFINTVSG